MVTWKFPGLWRGQPREQLGIRRQYYGSTGDPHPHGWRWISIPAGPVRRAVFEFSLVQVRECSEFRAQRAHFLFVEYQPASVPIRLGGPREQLAARLFEQRIPRICPGYMEGVTAIHVELRGAIRVFRISAQHRRPRGVIQLGTGAYAGERVAGAKLIFPDHGHSYYSPDRNNWAGRFGAAYNFGAGTTLRAGYEIFTSAHLTTCSSIQPTA